MKRALAPPRLLLSVRSLDGVTRAPRERQQELQNRFREPESLAVTLAKAVDAGAEGVLGLPSPALRAALAELDRVVPVCAVLPAVSPQAYRMLDPGVEPLIERARREAGPGARLRMGLTSLLRLSALHRGDFAARAPVLLEAGAGLLPRRGLAGVVIAAPFTDAALAGDHRGFFEALPRFVRSRFRAAAGFETRNPGRLLQRLREWGVEADYVVGPLNPRGLGMKPRPAEVLQELARGGVPLVASDLRAGGLCGLAEGVRHALDHGARGVAPDLSEMDEVAAELRGVLGTLAGGD